MNAIIRKLLEEIKPHYKKVFVIALTGLIYSLCYARLILSLKDIHKAFESGESQRVAHVALMTLALSLAVALSRYFHIYLMNFVAELVANSYRLQLQKKFMALNLSFHTQYVSGSGGLLSRILNDARVIQDGLRMVADFFREPLLAVLLLGNLLYLNWKLTLMIMILLPVILFFLKRISVSLRKYVLWGQENLEKITSTIKESIDGVRIIQSFNLEGTMSDRLKKESTDYLDIRKKVHSRIEIMSPVVEFVATAVILGIFFFFSSEVAKGSISTGDVLAYIASLMAINQPIKKLQESFVRIQETVVASERVFEILDNPNVVLEDPAPLPFPTEWKKIRYKNVSFKYDQSMILKNVSFEISRGQAVAFVGESGSGKSTIVNLLERFYDPTEGEILVDDIPLQRFSLVSLRKNVALVSQDVFLFSDTIEKNIWAGDFDKPSDLIQSRAQSANAHDFILRMPDDYKSRVGDRGSLLSGGEKQRVSLARAFFKDAPILILDEATSALDSSSEVEVQKGIDQLMKGRTSLVIAHRLSTIQNADCIFVLKAGEIVEQGSFAELIQASGELRRFYEIQSGPGQRPT